ncbi:MAG: MiaB/RimO family radical SAM methylthiotransferase [Eubacteriales bacterium]|nr:MiaB/RimO family radical SAM methylthiotransferase [Eubacteriales bacterium]
MGGYRRPQGVMARIYFHTLGCKVNVSDSSGMAQVLKQAGHDEVDADGQPDVIIVNTCAVTAEAARKSRQAVRRLISRYPGAPVVVTGCASQEAPDLYAGIPGVYAVSGTAGRGGIAALVDDVLRGQAGTHITPLGRQSYEDILTTSSQEHTRAFMKIQEGCDAHCAYCIIPSLRGAPRSRTLADIARQAAGLTGAGYVEVVLVGINLSRYGIDLPGRPALADAVDAALAGGVERLRLGSLDPGALSDDFLGRLAGARQVCPHFHVSLQSGSAGVLQAMGRRYTPAAFSDTLARVRRYFPQAAVTTDVIVGFPGETQRQFQESCAFVEAAGFAKVHVFPYSKRAGTRAAMLPGQLGKDELRRRAAVMTGIADAAEAAFYAGLPGTEHTVLLEAGSPEHAGHLQGYTAHYARVALPGLTGRGTLRRVRIEQTFADHALACAIQEE